MIFDNNYAKLHGAAKDKDKDKDKNKTKNRGWQGRGRGCGGINIFYYTNY